MTQAGEIDIPDRPDILILLGDKGGTEYRSMSDMLGYYYHSGHIELKQYHAGRRFHKLWHFSCLRERYAISRYSDERKGEVDAVDMAIMPMQFIEAKMAIIDPYARLAVFDVCCSNVSHGKGGRKFLRAGLNDLMAHFRKDDRQKSRYE